MGASGEWVPLYITFFLGIILFTVVPSVVGSFCNIDDFINNPNFSPVDCPVNDYAPLMSHIINFIANGYDIELFNLEVFSANINLFSVFGKYPNNVVQQFLAKSLASFSFLPENWALVSLALFFIGLVYSVARLIRG